MDHATTDEMDVTPGRVFRQLVASTCRTGWVPEDIEPEMLPPKIAEVWRFTLRVFDTYGRPPTLDELADEFPDFERPDAPEDPDHYAALVHQHIAETEIFRWTDRLPQNDGKGGMDIGAVHATVREWAASLNGATTGHALLRASDIEELPITWLWRDRIPFGAGTLFEGDGAAGKTTVLCDIAARVTTGEPWPDSTVEREPRNVLIFTAEDSTAKVLRPRLRVAGADLDRVVFAPEVICLPRDVALFERWITEVVAALVWMDPLSAYMALTEGKSNTEADVRQALRPVFEVADRHEAAVVGIRHLNKDSSMKAAYRGLGSVGFNAFARAVHLAAPDPRDPSRSVLACTKSNWGAKPPSLAYQIVEVGGITRVEWLGTAGLTSDELLQPARREPVAARCARDLEDFLSESEGPRFAQDVYEALTPLGYSREAIRDARYLLRVEVTGHGGATKWNLPHPTTQSDEE